MNHGGIGTLVNSEFQIPYDLLEPLYIHDGTVCEGVYYRTPTDDVHAGCDDIDDFVLSPIPIRIWPYVGKLIIRLKHEPRTLRHVAEKLLREGASIINAECTRSGHRYATWTLTVWCKSLDKKSNRIAEYWETQLELQRLKYIITSQLTDKILFRDQYNPNLQPVEWIGMGKLWNFATQVVGKTFIRDGVRYTAEDFQLKLNGGKLIGEGSKLRTILSEIGEKRELQPAILFAEMDTRAVCLRVAAIPPTRQGNFFEAIVTYQRLAKRNVPPTTVGLLHAITDFLPKHYNLWRVYNLTSKNTVEEEHGEVVLYIEDQSGAQQDSILANAQLKFKELKGRRLTHTGNIDIIEDPEVLAIDLEDVQYQLSEQEKNRRKRSSFEYHVFLSYADKSFKDAQYLYDQLTAAGIDVYFHKEKKESGVDFWARILDNIKQSREICVLYTKYCFDPNIRYGVCKEISAAWAHGHQITFFKPEGVDDTDLPTEYQTIEAYDFPTEIPRYIAEIKSRTRSKHRH